MDLNFLRKLAIEVFKTLKSLNPDFMHTYFQKCSHSARRKNELLIGQNPTFGEKSLRTLGPKPWISLREDVKDLTSLLKFSDFIKTWYGPECKCNICKFSGNPYHHT